jgi:hypothetical protein
VARAALETCPGCQRSLPAFGDWPAWCPECGWGLHTDEAPAVPSSRFVAWWRERTNRAEQAELQRLLADPALLARRHPRRTAIFAAAVVVHLVTIALIAVGAWVMTTGIVTTLKIGAGIVTFGLVAVTFPMHRLRPSRSADAPAVRNVASTVAAAVGVRPPKRVRVSSYESPLPPASGRVLTVDVDRWQTLDHPGRVALLGHELAHHNGHDPRRAMLVVLASETLDGWIGLLRPDPRAAARRRSRRKLFRGDTGTAPPPSRVVGISELILPIAIAPLYAAVLALGWVLREGGTVAGMRAELYADALADAVAGHAGARILIDGELAELAAGGNVATPLADLPEAERERRRRIAIATGSRVDAMHPTFAARLQVLGALRDNASAWSAAGLADRQVAAVSTTELDAATRELTAAKITAVGKITATSAG